MMSSPLLPTEQSSIDYKSHISGFTQAEEMVNTHVVPHKRWRQLKNSIVLGDYDMKIKFIPSVESPDNYILDIIKDEKNSNEEEVEIPPQYRERAQNWKMQMRKRSSNGKVEKKKYVEKVLDRFNMSNCKHVSTALGAHFKLSSVSCRKSDVDVAYMSKVPYSSVVGSLMYAMVCTRPDLAHAVSVVSRYMHNPGKEHWNVVKWILQYLKGTSSLGLVFDRSSSVSTDIVGFVDSDYVGKLRFSLLMCYLRLRRNTLQQQTVSKKLLGYEVWLWSLVFHKVRLLCSQIVKVLSISPRMIHIMPKPNTYIDVGYHFIRDVVAAGDIVVQKVHTLENPADMLTKPLPITKLKQCLSLVGCSNCSTINLIQGGDC
nr:Retrovirus-related Pol polyprotein from transposon TNT 1-94 [Ipomoea batatas]